MGLPKSPDTEAVRTSAVSYVVAVAVAVEITVVRWAGWCGGAAPLLK
jgi:hypothetical protein